MRVLLVVGCALVASLASALTIDDFQGSPLGTRTLSTALQSGHGAAIATVDEGLLYRSDPGTDGYAVLDYRFDGLDLAGVDAIEVGLTSAAPMDLSLSLYGDEGWGIAFESVPAVHGRVSIPLAELAGLIPSTVTGLRLVFDPPDGASFSVSAISAVPEPASLACVGVGVLGLLRRRFRS